MDKLNYFLLGTMVPTILSTIILAIASYWVARRRSATTYNQEAQAEEEEETEEVDG